jgi:hypothetical protein
MPEEFTELTRALSTGVAEIRRGIPDVMSAFATRLTGRGRADRH